MTGILLFKRGRLLSMFAMRVNLLLIFLFCSLFSNEEIATTDPLALPLPSNEEVAGTFPLSLISKKPSPLPPDQEGYKINYTTVPIIEYIRFVSKICKINFIYNEADLGFTITVVSDEPITPKNVMATLVQVLRIHDLELLEQDNNLVIHKSPGVKQIATLVTENQTNGTSPIVTRIFRSKNVKPDAIAAVVRPMISTSALLETLPENNQLILTDVTTNVDKVAALIENLDSPYTLLDIKNFEAKNNNPDFLIELAHQIMTPIAAGNPFILVPQNYANSIYIVSTPELIDKAVSVLTSLDIPPKKEVMQRQAKAENLFVYKAIHRTDADLLKGLANISNNLKQEGNPDPEILSTLDTAKAIPESNSILLKGTADSLNMAKEFLAALDVPGATAPEHNVNFFIYKPLHRNVSEIKDAIVEMGKNLSGTKGQTDIIETIDSIKTNTSTSTLIFSGDPNTFARVKEMLATIDTPTGKSAAAAPVASSFFLYKIQKSNPNDLQNSLINFAKTLDKSHAANKGLIDAITHLKYIKENNSLLFTGPDSDLKRLETLVPSFDTGLGQIPPSSQFFIYKPQNESGEQISNSLKEIATHLQTDELSDPAFLHALDSMKWIKSTHSLIFTGDPESLKRVESLVSSIDHPKNVTAPARSTFFIYKIQKANPMDLQNSLKDFAKTLDKTNTADKGLVEAINNLKYIKETHSLLFTGPDSDLKRLETLISSFDMPMGQMPPPVAQFFIYKPVNRNASDIESAIHEMGKNLAATKGVEPSIVEMIEGVKINPSTNTLIFSGDPKNFALVKEMLAATDTPIAKPTVASPTKSTFFIYKIQKANPLDLQLSLKDFAKTLDKTNVADKGLIDSIQNLKYIKENHSLLFTGLETDLKRLETLLPTFDTVMGQPPPPGSEFFIYKPINRNASEIRNAILEMGKNLAATKGLEPNIITTIEGVKINSSTNTLTFSGDPKNFALIKEMLSTIDTPTAKPTVTTPPPSSEFFIYKPVNKNASDIQSAILEMGKNLAATKGVNPSILATIEGVKINSSTHTLTFTGDPKDFALIKEMLSTIDTPTAKPTVPTVKSGYYIYKVQHTTGDMIEEDLETFAKNLEASGVKDPVIDIIEKMRYIKETNSLLFSGDSVGLDEIKTLVAQYDYPRTAAPTSSNFFMYKPQHVPAAKIESSLQEVAANLKKAGLADPNLLQSIETMKHVESTNSLIFTGTPDAIQKIQTLIKDIDIPPSVHAPIQHVGETTFLLYKLKYATAPQMIHSLKALAANLQKTSADTDLVNALNTMKYIKETNSLFFTGPEATLSKVQALVEKFDVAGTATTPTVAPVVSTPTGPIATNFFVYRPQAVPGPDLEKLLIDFGGNLKTSGLSDPELFGAIGSTRWDEQTKTLVFTGTPKALEQIKALLAEFDIPSAPVEKPLAPLEPSISSIDNVSFLVYKLQFHRGDEIQSALRQIAKDLTNSNAPINKNLLNTITSIQWLQVTNSLLAQGDQETITRLRELIKNLDVPLKQVFIEVLVIETSLTNALSFGLEWSGNYQFKNKFASTTSNTAPAGSTTSSSGASYSPDSLMQGMQNISPTNTPSINTVPGLPVVGTGGFDLGIIGEVIRHKGKTFLTLGSLLQALQTDTETSVVDAPKILTQDGRTSTIFVGENIPFVGSFVSNTSQNTINSTNIEYRDIGLSLTITPVLGNSDVVTLDITLDRSQTLTSVTQTTISNNTTANGIVTSKTTMDTTVHVPDNNFLILSGAVLNSTAKAKTGLPCLGGLPLVGALFSTSADVINNTNLVIFLRPHIISSVEDIRTLSRDQEEFFRDQAGTPFLERAFDESMEMIKTADDD